MPAKVRRRVFLVVVGAPLAILVGLLSVGAPGDGWGTSTSAGITTQSTHSDHSLTAPRRVRFADDLLRALSLTRALVLSVALIAALVAAQLAMWRRRAIDALLLPSRLRPGDAPVVLRGPPVLRAI